MSHHVIAAVRSPRIGGPPRVLNEETHSNKYEANRWISKSTARWCSELEPHESHVLIAIQNSQGKTFCLLDQPADWRLAAEKFTGTHLDAVLPTLRLESRYAAVVGEEPMTLQTQDMTDRNEGARA